MRASKVGLTTTGSRDTGCPGDLSFSISQLCKCVSTVGHGLRANEKDEHFAVFHSATNGRLIFETGRKILAVKEYAVSPCRKHCIDIFSNVALLLRVGDKDLHRDA